MSFDIEESIDYTLRKANESIVMMLEHFQYTLGGSKLFDLIRKFHSVDWGAKEPHKTLETIIEVRKYVLNNVAHTPLKDSFLLQTSILISRYQNYIADLGKGVRNMKVSEIYTLPLINVLDHMELVDFMFHHYNDGAIFRIELTYVPAQKEEENDKI